MVCPQVVKDELEMMGYAIDQIELGFVELDTERADLEKIARQLGQYGFELLDTKEAKLVEAIKLFIIAELEGSMSNKESTFTETLAQHLAVEYILVGKQISL